MVFYILLTISILFLLHPFKFGLQSTKLKVGIALLIFISIFRFDVGYDYPTYYNYVYPTLNELMVNKLEPLSQLIFRFAAYAKMPSLVFILYGLITYSVIFITLHKYSVQFYYSVIIYFCLFWLFSLGEIRQATALAIAFSGYRFLLSKSFIKYILICTFAALFHASALVAIIIYPLHHYAKWWLILIFTLLLYFGAQFILNFFAENGIYRIYINQLIAFKGGDLMKLFFIIFYLMVMITYLSKKNQKEQTSDDKKLLMLIFPSIIFPFIFAPVISLRVSMYFSIYYCILIPSIFINLTYLKRILILIMVGYFLTNIYVGSLNKRSSYTPYQSIFFIDNPKFRF